MAHEFGHDINWPDLYDTDQHGEGVGEWSLMGSGSWGESTTPGHQPGDSPTYPDAYSLYYQGWIMPTVATVADNIAISAHQSLLLGPNPAAPTGCFNEHRGYRRVLPAGEPHAAGLRHLHARLRHRHLPHRRDRHPEQRANSDEDDPLITVMQADGLENLENGDNRGDAGDPWPGTGKHDFNNGSTPNTKFHEGTASNLALHVDDNACAATMHVDVTHLGDASPPVVRPSNDMFANAVVVTGASGNQTEEHQHATVEPGEPKRQARPGVGLVPLDAPASGTATLTTAGSDYDTVLGLYTGSAVNALTHVAENDDQEPRPVFTSKVMTHVTAGTAYQIAADGYGGDSGFLRLALVPRGRPECRDPPSRRCTHPSPRPSGRRARSTSASPAAPAPRRARSPSRRARPPSVRVRSTARQGHRRAASHDCSGGARPDRVLPRRHALQRRAPAT